MLTSKLLKNRKNAKFDTLQLYLSLKNREIKYSRNMAHDFSQNLIHAKLSENKVAQGRLFTIFPDFPRLSLFSRLFQELKTLSEPWGVEIFYYVNAFLMYQKKKCIAAGLSMGNITCGQHQMQRSTQVFPTLTRHKWDKQLNVVNVIHLFWRWTSQQTRHTDLTE